MKKKFLLPLVLVSFACKKQIETVTTINTLDLASSITATPQATAVVIGSQIWTQQNLAVTKYRNGQSIKQIPYKKGDRTWSNTTEGAWCYYNNDPKTAKTYGLLYNYYAITDPRGLAPAGWHIPSKDEWEVLSEFLGYGGVAGGKMKAVTPLWNPPNYGATNSSGFTGLPGGYRSGYGDGVFYSLNKDGYWWTTTQGSGIWIKYLAYNNDNLTSLIYPENSGLSVRCIKN